MSSLVNNVARVELPLKLIPVFQGEARYRGAYGGRGSGKTRSFAKMTALKAFQWSQAREEGVILCARKYMNSLNDSSKAEIKAAILSEPWLKKHFIITESGIKTKNNCISFRFTGLYQNLDSLKSKAKIKLLWVDEAENIQEDAWKKLIPTIREENSEIWVTWNPESEHSATHKRFRQNKLENAKIVEMNWRDNPWFPKVLDYERQQDLALRSESYNHIWEGGFLNYIQGSYFIKDINVARLEKRIGHYKRDSFAKIRAFWDIGGSGAKADATAIWIAQFIDDEIRVLDYYEARCQSLQTHIQWLIDNSYDDALMFLPHDGATKDRVYDVSFKSALEEKGFFVEVIPNQGVGASRMRIEAARRLFHKMKFHEETTQNGIKALSWYHEKWDPIRNIGLGPSHDWSSHAADAFGLLCIVYEEPVKHKKRCDQKYQKKRQISWMAG